MTFVSIIDSGLVASQMYTAENEVCVGLNSNVLFVVLSETPLPSVIDTPNSIPVNVVRELSVSTRYHVIVGLGMPMAMHTKIAASSGRVTIKSTISRVSMGAAKQNNYGNDGGIWSSLGQLKVAVR